MKFNLIPVILTAATTSIVTMVTVSHFQQPKPYFEQAAPVNKSDARFANFAGLAGNAAAVSFENAAESSVKAVVHIKTTTNGRTVITNSNDMFSQLFGQRQYYIPPQSGSGSGVVISPDGYIVTNNHVVAEANEVTVTFNDRYTAQAKVIGADAATDIAVLKVDGDKNLPFMEFGNSDDVRLGQWVLAVGYPLSLDATVTAGIVSAKGRSLGINKTRSASAIESFIQTDAAVNPGNSGGALVSTSGQLIGINSAIASPTGSYAGYSYAIPANIVRKAVNDLMKYGSLQRGYLGIEFLDSRSENPELLAHLGLNKKDGVYAMDVTEKSGAAKAGILKGDFITQINGQPVNSPAEIQGLIARFQPGDNVSVRYIRDNKTFNVTVQLTNLNGTTEIVNAANSVKMFGATFRPLTDKEKAGYNVDGGIIVENIGNGVIAKQTQMHNGFIVTTINDRLMHTMNDFQIAISESKNLQIGGFYPKHEGMYYYGLNNVKAMNGQ